MAEQLNNLQLLDESGTLRGLRPAEDLLKLQVPIEVTKGSKFLDDLYVGGDLTVQGDVVSRGSVNVVSKDAVIDLGVGNYSGVAQPGGFTVQVNKATGFTELTVTAFQSKADAAGDANFTVADASSLSIGDVVAIANAGKGENDGYYVVKSKAGGVVSVEPSAMHGLPFAQTNFETASAQSAVAYKVNLGVVVVADGALTKSAGVYWDAGTLLTAYAAPATKAAFQADGAYQGASDVTLDEAYNFGNTITTNSTDGDVVIAGTQKLDITASNGLSVTNGSTLSGAVTMGSTVSVTGAATLSSTLGVSGESTLASAIVSDLTDNRIVLAGTSGALEDDANLTFDGTDFKIATNKFTVAVASGNTSVGGTLGVTGAATLSSTISVSGAATLSSTLGVTGESTLASAIVSDLTDNRIVIAGTAGALEDDANFTFDGTDFKIATNKFTVAVASGNTSVAGTFGVTGAATLSSTLGVTGESTLASATVSDLTNNRIVIAGTAGALEDDANFTFDGTDLKVGPSFTVTQSSGNTSIGGTLGVSGAATLSGTLGVTGEATLASATVSDLTDNRIVLAGTSGALEDSADLTFDGTDFKIATNKFVVTAASGNTSVAGTLGVSGDASFTATGGSEASPDFGVAGYAKFAGVMDINGSIDADVTGMDVLATNQAKIVSSQANLGAITLQASNALGGIVIDAGDALNIDAGKAITIDGKLSSNFTVTANDAADQGLTLKASNSGAGKSFVSIESEEGNTLKASAGASVVQRVGTGGTILEVKKDANLAFVVADAQIDSIVTHNFGKAAGIQLQANASATVNAGTVCAFDPDGKMVKANAVAGGNSPSAAQEVVRYPFAAAAINVNADASATFSTVPGTMINLTFDAAPAAGLVGQAVYLGAGANAGKVTLTAPMDSNASIWRVGLLAGKTADGAGNYKVYWHPQYLGRRPVA